jgi:3-hydroxyisobutyrate dehydrogenase-like beta-hydroxyacid dehydrogenase
MIGGDQAVFEANRANFEPMGKRLYYCGGPGMGLHAKLTQNLILSNLLQAFNEGLVLSTKAGVDPALMLDILDNSAAKSGLIAFKAPYVFRRDFSTNFSVKWMHKDIGPSRQAMARRISALQSRSWRGSPAPKLRKLNICFYGFLLQSRIPYPRIGIKPGRQLPPKRD